MFLFKKKTQKLNLLIMERKRRFCITWNNYTDDSLDLIKKLKYSYVIVGKEKGKKETPHYQIYIEFKHAKTFTEVINAFKKKCHIEIAKGNAEQNQTYCSKQETIFEDGTPKKQGKRNDLLNIRDNITDGMGVRDIVDAGEVKNLQGLRTIECMLKYYEPKRTEPPKIIWIYGGSGKGKTTKAYDMYPDIYEPISMKWWEGYDKHKEVLIDDFREDYMDFSTFLRFTGGKPFRIEFKGGSRQLLCDTIVFTSSKHPKDIFEEVRCGNEDEYQVTRRIHEIYCVDKIVIKKKKKNTEVGEVIINSPNLNKIDNFLL